MPSETRNLSAAGPLKRPLFVSRLFGHPSRITHGYNPCRILMDLIFFLVAVLWLTPPPLASERPQSLENYLSEAKQLEDKKDYDGAIRVYRQALRTMPDQPELLKRLGVIYQTELKFAESIQAFQKVLLVDPKYPEANFYLGVSFLGYNDYDKALACFNQELKFHPDYGRAHMYAANALLALGRAGEAVQHYQALTQQDPKDARVWFELASVYRSLAVHAYKRLDGIDPDSFMVDILRGEATSDDLRYEEAIKWYKQALRKQPNFPGLHFALGQVYFKMDKIVEAEPELRLALKENPGNPSANYMLGEILVRNGKAREAVPFLQVAEKGDPTFMKGHLELGKCYLQLGNIADAQIALSRAVQADPHSPEPHILLVQVYTRLKDEEKRNSELGIIQKLRQEAKKPVQRASEKASQQNK